MPRAPPVISATRSGISYLRLVSNHSVLSYASFHPSPFPTRERGIGRFGIIQKLRFRVISSGSLHGSSPKIRRLPFGLWMDALMIWRGLFERSELARPPIAGVHLLDCGRTGRQWFWLLLPKQKGLGCRAETRQYS